ncbi:MAG: MarR family transcriptional regulator [Frondihabitans sp.]|nr:MarR family transcriptional regulator [Frondihabitans sp.]
MDDRPGIGSLLSQVLVAHTIAFDNMFEAWMPHQTSLFGRGGPPAPVVNGRPIKPPWLVSRVMWENVLRIVPRDGVPRKSLAGTGGNVSGLLGWGYLYEVDGNIRLTRGGHVALRVWQEIDATFDDGWRQDFGDETIGRVLGALDHVSSLLGRPTFRFMPIVTYADGMRMPRRTTSSAPAEGLAGDLSRAVQQFTLDYEERSELSLAIGANVLRILGPEPRRLRDLPLATGVSREAVDASVRFLARGGLAETLPGPSVALTAEGELVREADRRILGVVESDWSGRVGAPALGELEAALHDVLASPALPAALSPRPGLWRTQGRYQRLTEAFVSDPAGRLPHHPVLLHRGGFPDGS